MIVWNCSNQAHDVAAFNSQAAAERYAQFDTVELANIAYLDPNYLPEAKKLAERELARRGALRNKASLLEQARQEMAYRASAMEQANYATLERGLRFKLAVWRGGMIACLWVFAFIAPLGLPWKFRSTDWVLLLPIGVWLFSVVDAARKYETSGRRSLVLLAYIPAALFFVSWLIRVFV